MSAKFSHAMGQVASAINRASKESNRFFKERFVREADCRIKEALDAAKTNKDYKQVEAAMTRLDHFRSASR